MGFYNKLLEHFETNQTLYAAPAFKILIILLVYVVVRFFLLKVVDRTTNRLLEAASGELEIARDARIKSLKTISRSVVRTTLGLVAFAMVLTELGLDIGALLATAGIAGLAIGFGAQKLVRDTITGFFIIVENQYGVGEYITIGPVTGMVTDMGLRITKLRSDDGLVHIIANGDITRVTNHSRGGVATSIELTFTYDTDINTVRDLLEKVCSNMTEEHIEKIVRPFSVEGVVAQTGQTYTLLISGEVKVPFDRDAIIILNEKVGDALRENSLTLA